MWRTETWVISGHSDCRVLIKWCQNAQNPFFFLSLANKRFLNNSRSLVVGFFLWNESTFNERFLCLFIYLYVVKSCLFWQNFRNNVLTRCPTFNRILKFEPKSNNFLIYSAIPGICTTTWGNLGEEQKSSYCIL